MEEQYLDRFKFRAWSVKYKDYIYDIQEVGCNFNIKCNEDCFGDFLGVGDFTDGKIQYSYIIEQCTGLKDKNGKLIYEGDILKCVHSEIMKYKIYWARCGYRMKVYGTDNKLVDDTVIFLDTSTLEIIGNIHENPELLGEKNEE